MNLETNKFFIGKKASLTKLITEDEVKQFAKISLDTNPAHLDHQYAATTMFKKPIAHGMLTGALVSAVLGTLLPGPGAMAKPRYWLEAKSRPPPSIFYLCLNDIDCGITLP
jgi:acyl dehydratase